ncbi:MAG: hypothetical protein WD738_06625 [Pirellulales bacterium]
MLKATSLVRIGSGVLGCVLATLVSSPARAQTIDVSLNVHFSDPEDLDSGGTWEVVAKSSHFGIGALSLRLASIDPVVEFDAPSGLLNDTTGAGFTIQVNTSMTGGRNVILGQTTLPPGQQQGIFYGVGTIVNGEPGDVGPSFPPGSLTNLENVPWAPEPPGDFLGDAAWDIAATFASGTFDEGFTLAFLSGTSGQVFTTSGTATTYGTLVPATISTIIRTDALAEAFPDYNDNGVVDAADFVLWRKGVFPEADGNNNGMIDSGDYDLWREHFGEIVPGAGSGANIGLSSGAVPEPASAALLAFGATDLLARRNRRTRTLSIAHPAPRPRDNFLREHDGFEHMARRPKPWLLLEFPAFFVSQQIHKKNQI